ncbi:MAG: rhodanese-like domain-containing protein [Elusimicrobia bacterium]|nr:rhodanese-like domain-containing protein [Elusimicrobiota bacterium]
MSTAIEITKNSTMQEILDAYPGAQSALFSRYHVGGCSSCGFQPGETLEQVCQSHSIGDVEEVIQHIKSSADAEQALSLSPQELQMRLEKSAFKIIDIRTPEEFEMLHLEEARPATQELVEEVLTRWPKDSEFVLVCHDGKMSREAASNLRTQGFVNVKALKGGLAAWSKEIDPLFPSY